MDTTDEFYMLEAFREAEKAMRMDEVPVGAVIVCGGKIIARGHNMTQRLNDVTAHAEMIAITAASNHLQAKYLDQCTIYVTLEPCLMCAGACSWAQMERMVYGASDPKKGYSNTGIAVLHPKTIVTIGIHADRCGKILKEYFESKRNGG